MYGAQFGFDVSSNLAVEARVRYNDVAHAMDNFSLREAPAPTMHRLNRADGSGSQFYLASTLEKGESTFVLGVDGIDASHESIITNPNNAMFRVDNFIDVERDLLGAFAEAQIDAVSGELEFGLRYNHVSTNAGDVAAAGMMGMMANLVGQLASTFNSADRDISWNTLDAVIKYSRPLSASIEWRFEVGSKSRAPSYQELYLWLPMQATGGLADGRTYIGNLDLSEERSNEIVIGVGAQVGAFSISPQVFYRRVDDYIQGVPSTNMTANMVAMMMNGSEPLQFDNVDAEIWGFDAAWGYELSDSLLLDGIVSLARGQRRDINDHLYRLSPLNGSVGLTYSADTWSLKSEIIGYADQDRVSITNDETGTSGYWLLNLGYTWQPLAALRIEARVDNLLDETYQNHVTGINRAAGSDIPVGERLFGVERTLSAGLIYSF
jgi:iron complex outermembrane receptor protein